MQHVIETPSIFAPVSTLAFAIRDRSFYVLHRVIFVIDAGVAVYTLVRLGRRSADPEVEPAQVNGSTQIKLTWTTAPLFIVAVLFLVTARYIWGIGRGAQPPDALAITGHHA